MTNPAKFRCSSLNSKEITEGGPSSSPPPPTLLDQKSTFWMGLSRTNLPKFNQFCPNGTPPVWPNKTHFGQTQPTLPKYNSSAQIEQILPKYNHFGQTEPFLVKYIPICPNTIQLGRKQPFCVKYIEFSAIQQVCLSLGVYAVEPSTVERIILCDLYLSFPLRSIELSAIEIAVL